MRKKLIFAGLTVLMIGFIWCHSAMPGEMSSTESGFVARLIQAIIGGDNIEDYVRKMAHFFEFMLLGILLAVDSLLWLKKTVSSWNLYIGLLIPAIDETIQLFVIDRNGSLMDVWLDYSGLITGLIFSTVVYKVMKKG